MNAPQPRAGVLKVQPYVAGESTIANVKRVIKLASNEGALGPSPKAVAAARGTAQSLCRYPDGGCVELRQALARHYHLDAANITCGAGSDELIGILIRAYAGAGDEVLCSQYGFLMYAIGATAVGATPVMAPEKDITADIDSLLRHVSPKTRLVFLANPNNPTGTYLPASEIRRLHRGLPKNVLLVLDSAYTEYMTEADYESGVELAATADNVVVTRTFSKIHALGGLRVGWCTGAPAVIDVINRVRGPFNVSTPAQNAAIAALADQGHVDKVREHTRRWRDRVTTALRKLGFTVTDSFGNFVLINFGDTTRADAADAHLRRHGIILRPLKPYGLTHCLRATIGTGGEMRAMLAALKTF